MEKKAKPNPKTKVKAVEPAKKKPAPKIQQMPWQRVKYDKLRDKKVKQKLTLSVHKNLIVLISWYAAGSIKDVLRFGSTCKRFRECIHSQIVWFFLYIGKGWKLTKELIGDELLVQKIQAKVTPDSKWSFIRESEEIKVDWEEQYKLQFNKAIGKKVTSVAQNFNKFFEVDVKKQRKNMKKYLQGFKFNLKILYNDGKNNIIIPASKIIYFEHSLWATHHPKGLLEISKIKNFEIQAVSKAKELQRTVTSKFIFDANSLNDSSNVFLSQIFMNK